jgi:hypothetical protein
MIIIMGDSWGVGEWGPIRNPVTGQKQVGLSGPGIGQLFSLHGKVINVSQGGSDNFQQVNEFAVLLERFRPAAQDVFYWIVTDPLRNLAPADIGSQGSITDFARSQLAAFLQQVQALAKLYDIRVNLIGGLCDLNTIDTEPGPYIHTAVTSWGQLLMPNYRASMFSDDSMAEWGPYLHSHRPDLLPEWTEITEQALQKRRSWDQLNVLGLFQYNHPTTTAHALLRNHLCPEWSDWI